MFKKLKEVIENKAFRKFFVRAGLFSYVFVAEIIFLGLMISFRGKDLGIKTVFSDFPVNFLIFFILFFLAMGHRDLFKVKMPNNLTRKRFVPFFLLNLFAIFSFYAFTQYLINNPAAGFNSILFTLVWWLLGLFILLFLAFAFFEWDYIKYLATKKHILVAGGFAAVLAYMVPKWFFTIWPSFSTLLAKIGGRIVYWMLTIFLNGVNYTLDSEFLPTISVPGFTAKVGTSCSGVSGIVLFLVLFTVFALIEYKRLDFAKVLILYPVAVVMMFVFNILRIFAIFMAGHYINPTFAMGIFHKNVGWILFTTYFLAFIYITYPWIRKDNKTKKIKKKR